MTQHFAGFDVGGTKTLTVVIDGAGKVLHQTRLPRPCGDHETIDQLAGLITDCEQTIGATIDAVGVGIAGLVNRSGDLTFSPNIPELVNFSLRTRLADRLNRRVVVDNDATAATWAEHKLGAAQGIDDVLYVALGTGIGTGFVLNGSMYRGANGFAGESGHMVIDRHGDKHVSGARGPWEMFASGNGLGALARRWAADGKLPAVSARANEPSLVKGEHLSAEIAEGNPAALAALDDFSSHVAVGLANLIYVLDPACIVIGGGLVEIGEPLRASIQGQLDAALLGGDYRPPVPVRLAELGSLSAALGAAMLAADGS